MGSPERGAGMADLVHLGMFYQLRTDFQTIVQIFLMSMFTKFIVYAKYSLRIYTKIIYTFVYKITLSFDKRIYENTWKN